MNFRGDTIQPIICIVSLPCAMHCAEFWRHTLEHGRQFLPSQNLVKGTKSKEQNHTISKVNSAAIGPGEGLWENIGGAAKPAPGPTEAAPWKRGRGGSLKDSRSQPGKRWSGASGYSRWRRHKEERPRGEKDCGQQGELKEFPQS